MDKGSIREEDLEEEDLEAITTLPISQEDIKISGVQIGDQDLMQLAKAHLKG